MLPYQTLLFRVPSGLVRIFDRDLALAGIDKRDDQGRVLDVHGAINSLPTLGGEEVARELAVERQVATGTGGRESRTLVPMLAPDSDDSSKSESWRVNQARREKYDAINEKTESKHSKGKSEEKKW